MPAARSRSSYTLIQKLIKQNWPNATALKNIRNHQEDVPRKLLMLLYVVTENSLNPYGNAHGGWLFALCDTCSGLAASTRGRPNVTLQASVNYIRGVKPGDTVTVKAFSRHSGGRTAVNQVELFDGQGRLLLTSSFTMYYMDGKK